MATLYGFCYKKLKVKKYYLVSIINNQLLKK